MLHVAARIQNGGRSHRIRPATVGHGKEAGRSEHRILDPMNALVSDQVGRLRKMVGDKQGSFLDIWHRAAGDARRSTTTTATATTGTGSPPLLQRRRQAASDPRPGIMRHAAARLR